MRLLKVISRASFRRSSNTSLSRHPGRVRVKSRELGMLLLAVSQEFQKESPVPRQNVVRAKNREISRRVHLKMKRKLNLESSPTPRCSLPATSERIPHAYINVKGEVRAWCFRAERLG